MAGFTPLSTVVDAWVDYTKKAGYKYEEFSKKMLDEGMTPMFEWVEKDRKVIIPYEENKLTLIAIRNIDTGYELTKNAESLIFTENM